MEGNNFDEWHEGQIKPVPKSGYLSDTNKWIGVALLDIGEKIFISILCGISFKIIKSHGVKYQFGSTTRVGYQDVSFTLNNLLHLRHNQNLPSWVAFAYLVRS